MLVLLLGWLLLTEVWDDDEAAGDEGFGGTPEGWEPRFGDTPGWSPEAPPTDGAFSAGDADAGPGSVGSHEGDGFPVPPAVGMEDRGGEGPSGTELVVAGVAAHGVVEVIKRAWLWLRGEQAPGPAVEASSSSLVAESLPPLGGHVGGEDDLDSADGLARERAVLIDALVDIDESWGDRFESLREKVRRSLARVGVEAVVPPHGARFDPEQHESFGAEPTDDPARDGTIMSTDFAGFADRGNVVRTPRVTIFRSEASQ